MTPGHSYQVSATAVGEWSPLPHGDDAWTARRPRRQHASAGFLLLIAQLYHCALRVKGTMEARSLHATAE